MAMLEEQGNESSQFNLPLDPMKVEGYNANVEQMVLTVKNGKWLLVPISEV